MPSFKIDILKVQDFSQRFNEVKETLRTFTNLLKEKLLVVDTQTKSSRALSNGGWFLDNDEKTLFTKEGKIKGRRFSKFSK